MIKAAVGILSFYEPVVIIRHLYCLFLILLVLIVQLYGD